MAKFRAWHKTEKRMFDLVGIDWLMGWVFELLPDWKARLESKGLNPQKVSLQMSYDLKDVIIMENVGVKDKNGRYIFRADILKVQIGDNVYHGIVVFDKSKAKWIIDCQFEVITFDELEYDEETNRFLDVEIVGNFYENYEIIRQAMYH